MTIKEALTAFAMNTLFYLRVVLRAIWCFIMIIVFVFAYFGLILPFLPLKWLWPRLWWGYEGKLTRWLMACIGYWGYTAGYDVIEYGDDLTACMRERCVVICNHQSTADVPVLMGVLQTKGTASRKMCWVMAAMFKWSPFGLISQVHGDHFINEGKTIRDQELENLKRHLRKTFWDRDRWWVMLFPEGGFLYKRLEGSQRYAEKNNYPVLKYVTLPRTGAFQAILQAIGPRKKSTTNGSGDDDVSSAASSDTEIVSPGDCSPSSSTSSDRPMINTDETNIRLRKMSPPTVRPTKMKLLKDTVGAIREKKYVKETRPPVKYVVDITIGFTDGVALSADQLWLGTRKQCEDIHVYDANTVPFHDEEGTRIWLYDRFVEKEHMLANFYRTGEMCEGEIGRRINFGLPKILIQYLFWFCAAYANYRFYFGILSSIATLVKRTIFG